MRPARRADPPHRPDHSKKPRSPLPSPSPDRLPDPSAGAQSFTHSDTDISLPPIASYPTPQLGSKMTKARTAVAEGGPTGRRKSVQMLFRQALRSEEHTSELQSLRHLVCRLLL